MKHELGFAPFGVLLHGSIPDRAEAGRKISLLILPSTYASHDREAVQILQSRV